MKTNQTKMDAKHPRFHYEQPPKKPKLSLYCSIFDFHISSGSCLWHLTAEGIFFAPILVLIAFNLDSSENPAMISMSRLSFFMGTLFVYGFSSFFAPYIPGLKRLVQLNHEKYVSKETKKYNKKLAKYNEALSTYNEELFDALEEHRTQIGGTSLSCVSDTDAVGTTQVKYTFTFGTDKGPKQESYTFEYGTKE